MKIEVRYVSRSGNTKKIADSIAKAVGVSAGDCTAPTREPVDLLFLGGSIYAGGVDKSLAAFISKLDPAKVNCVAVFGTAAIKKEPEREVEKLVREKNIPVLRHSFHCRGSFAVLHRGCPNSTDLQQAAAFALKAVEAVK